MWIPKNRTENMGCHSTLCQDLPPHPFQQSPGCCRKHRTWQTACVKLRIEIKSVPPSLPPSLPSLPPLFVPSPGLGAKTWCQSQQALQGNPQTSPLVSLLDNGCPSNVPTPPWSLYTSPRRVKPVRISERQQKRHFEKASRAKKRFTGNPTLLIWDRLG